MRPRGISLQELGRHQEAIACLDEAIRLDPKNAFAHTGPREDHCRSLGDTRSATCLDRAIGPGLNYQ